ncbi:MAG: IS6 family transposase [Candidatus Bathyarchaeia archaeon]
MYCGSSRVVRNGTRNGLQGFLCRDCGRQFNERSGTLFAGMKYKPEEVVFALRLKFNYRLSSREASELMAELGHPVSKNTVLFWVDRFADSFETLQRLYRPEYSKILHIDELHVRLRGGKGYVYAVEDDRRNIIALELTWRKDGEATARALRKAREEAGSTPDIIVSDGAPAYPPAIEEAIPGARHVVAQFKGTPVSQGDRLVTVSNNLLERLNGTLRGWVRSLRGFKSLAAGNRALTVLQAVYNLLRPHQGLGGLTPFQASGGGGLTWNTLSQTLSAAL